MNDTYPLYGVTQKRLIISMMRVTLLQQDVTSTLDIRVFDDGVGSGSLFLAPLVFRACLMKLLHSTCRPVVNYAIMIWRCTTRVCM